MVLNTERTRRHLQAGDLKTLFVEELGWDRFRTNLPVTVGTETFMLTAVAEKRGVQVFQCPPSVTGRIPEYAVRRKIEAEVTKAAFQHVIIFTDGKNATQIWQWAAREAGKPLAYREQPYHRSQSGDALLQKLELISFSLSEEEGLTLSGVTFKLKDAFDKDKVTKKFYERFQKEHDSFLDFIKNIPDADFQRWYASVMINRLMFLYFIQAKGFLDSDPSYLKNKLKHHHGHFYKNFLCPLFFDGFAQRNHSPETTKKLGKVPYLNGGLFAKHQIEEQYGTAITIPDEAFEKLFAFFDGYNWHLDDRPLKNDNEINPDVLGYIFEKYINQKQMGAYYTKEDITEYIGKNTILPFLLDRAREDCQVAFQGEGGLWRLLREDPDRYVYPAVKHGIRQADGTEISLPEFIAQGIDSVAARGDWNKPAPSDYALPTEIWREVVARRQRYAEVRAKLSAGEVQDAGDLITYNLDIRQFSQDCIEQGGSDFLLAVWNVLNGTQEGRLPLSILDPTCGSGAFLFAALEILDPLYEACLERMASFVADADLLGHGKDHAQFRDILKGVASHADRRYFVLKSIIVNNLFGVDIMEEATEICKLRLFLTLAAQVDADPKKENFGIEPLPDIDFNIRAGNTLVGFATEAQTERAVTSRLDFENVWPRIQSRAAAVAKQFEAFQKSQSDRDADPVFVAGMKKGLRDGLKPLREELDTYLGQQYGKIGKENLAAWKDSAKPFHWFIEFYKVIEAGGFDVIIGNPPYVEYSKVKNQYQVKDYITEDCSNLYAFAIERSYQLVQSAGAVGLIVPIALVSVSETRSLRSFLLARPNTYHFSNFAIRPAKLFEGVEQRLTILISSLSDSNQRRIWSSKYHQWYVEERPNIMSNIKYGDVTSLSSATQIPKLDSNQQADIVSKVSSFSQTAGTKLVSHSQAKLFFHRTPGYWIRMMDFEPYFKSPTANRSIHHIRELFVVDKDTGQFIGAIGSSSLYFFWFFGLGNCRNITLDDVKSFRIGSPTANLMSEVSQLYKQLMIDFKNKSSVHKRGVTEFQEFNWGASKPIIDQIDRVLAKHYGFTDEETDFIINYDIKYRMGRGGDAEDE